MKQQYDLLILSVDQKIFSLSVNVYKLIRPLKTWFICAVVVSSNFGIHTAMPFYFCAFSLLLLRGERRLVLTWSLEVNQTSKSIVSISIPLVLWFCFIRPMALRLKHFSNAEFAFCKLFNLFFFIGWIFLLSSLPIARYRSVFGSKLHCSNNRY